MMYREVHRMRVHLGPAIVTTADVWTFEFFYKLSTTTLGMQWAIRLLVFPTALLTRT